MDVRDLVIEFSEKIGVMATAGLLTVLIPPLRNRLLGVGQPRDTLVASLYGLIFAMWGGRMSVEWMDYDVHLLAIGVLIAAILGGPRAGAVTGLFAGLFYIFRVDPDAGIWPVLVSIGNGVFGGLFVDRAPRLFRGWRAFPTCLGVQLISGLCIAPFLIGSGESVRYMGALPAVAVQLLGVAAGATLFLVTARVVLSREENAVALVKARSAADSLALDALRRRLEPHFLFNALNTIRATIRIDPQQARALVSDLADLYRYLLNHPDDAPLHKEVEHACAYLAIERVRLGGGKLVVETDIDPSVRLVRVPALLLQPLVENAVKHGVASRAGKGKVRIVANHDAEALTIEVIDTGSGASLGESEPGSGLALRTLRERLSISFGDDASLSLHKNDEGSTARVRLPWRLLDHPEPEGKA